MSSSLPPPPDPFNVPYNLDLWDTDKPIVRVRHSNFGDAEFNPGKGGGRFHPLRDDAGQFIPTLYGSNTINGALSETVFHDVPVSGPGKAIAQAALMPLASCTLRPKRMLRLIQLHGFGLKKLRVTRTQMVESDADQYSVTRLWGEALYRRAPEADGMIWMSRQHDSSEAIVLFGTRVRQDDLLITAAPRSLHPPGAGWHDVLVAAEAADITILITEAK